MAGQLVQIGAHRCAFYDPATGLRLPCSGHSWNAVACDLVGGVTAVLYRPGRPNCISPKRKSCSKFSCAHRSVATLLSCSRTQNVPPGMSTRAVARLRVLIVTTPLAGIDPGAHGRVSKLHDIARSSWRWWSRGTNCSSRLWGPLIPPHGDPRWRSRWCCAASCGAVFEIGHRPFSTNSWTRCCQARPQANQVSVTRRRKAPRAAEHSATI